MLTLLLECVSCPSLRMVLCRLKHGGVTNIVKKEYLVIYHCIYRHLFNVHTYVHTLTHYHDRINTLKHKIVCELYLKLSSCFTADMLLSI